MTDEQRTPRDDTDTEFSDHFLLHLPAVIAFFRRRGFKTDEARDLAQDTFVRAFHSWEGFRRESSFKTWVLRIAANVWRNELRARGRQKRSASPLASFDEAADAASNDADLYSDGNGTNGPYDAVWAQQRRELVHRALRELPPQMQRCLLLHVSKDLKYREIATTMNISIGAVKTQLSFARARLRSVFHDALDEKQKN